MCSDHIRDEKGLFCITFMMNPASFSHDYLMNSIKLIGNRGVPALCKQDRLKDISLILNLNLLLTTGLIQGIITMITNYKYNYRLAKSNKQRIIRHCFKSHNI